MSQKKQANRSQRPIQAAGTPLEKTGRSPEDFRPNMLSEVTASLRRALKVHDPARLADTFDRKPATIYAWQGKEAKNITVLAAEALVEFDPDADYPMRMATHWLEIARRRALLRQAHGEVATVINTVYPVKATPEAIRRATGRPDLGDD